MLILHINILNSTQVGPVHDDLSTASGDPKIFGTMVSFLYNIRSLPDSKSSYLCRPGSCVSNLSRLIKV